MKGFVNRVPYINKDILCSEISVKQYKVILKSLLTSSLTEDFNLNVNFILSSATNLSNDELNDLNFIEYFALLVYLKMINAGGILKLVLTDDSKKLNFSVDLSKTLLNLSTALTLQDKTINCNNIIVTVGIPTFINFIKIPELTLTSFIKKLTINNKVITNVNDITVLVNTFTPLYFKAIITECNLLVDNLQNLFFFKSPVDKYNMPFVVTPKYILYLLKLVFSDNLYNYYNDMFYLSKLANISAEYLENCTPGEFRILVNLLEETLKKKEDTSTQMPVKNVPLANPLT